MVECPACGVPECHQVYDELACFTLTLGDPEFIHQLIVDAYAAQHVEPHTKPITVAFAVIGMYLVNEHRYTGRQAQLAHVRLAQRNKSWPRLAGPTTRASMNVADVLAAADRQAAIRRWNAAVWDTWRPQQAQVDALARRHLEYV